MSSLMKLRVRVTARWSGAELAVVEVEVPKRAPEWRAAAIIDAAVEEALEKLGTPAPRRREVHVQALVIDEPSR